MLEQQPDSPGNDAGGFNLGDLIPDNAPPWLVALGVVLAFLLATSPIWGPAGGAWLRGLVPARGGQHAADGSDTGAPVAVRPAVERVDAGMAVIADVVERQEQKLARLEVAAERRETELQEALRENGELRTELAEARAEVRTLRRYLDRALDERSRPSDPT